MEIKKISENLLLITPIALAVKDYLVKKGYSYPFKRVTGNSIGAAFVIARRKQYQIVLSRTIEKEKSLISVTRLDNGYVAAYLYKPFAFKDVDDLAKRLAKVIDENIHVEEALSYEQ